MPPDFKDYYQVLGITPNATDDEIRKAFRSLARKYHPDVAKDKKSAEEKFKEINEANEVLSNPESRRKFDQLGAEWKADQAARANAGPGRQGGAGPQTASPGEDFQFGGTGFSDFFEQFFSGRAGRHDDEGPFETREFGTGRGQPTRARRGHDIHGDILITLDEVLRGGLRSISVRSARADTGGEQTETYQVRIPKGVLSGQSIRLTGKGGAGTNGGASGDIFLRVRYAQHADWRVQGSDLVGEVKLAPWEAVLGATVSVTTLESHVKVRIPAGFQQGQTLRVRGKGLPSGPTGFGDLYLEGSIQVPVGTNAEEERLWKELAKSSRFSPRPPA
jgi:curved DNA-binding protein